MSKHPRIQLALGLLVTSALSLVAWTSFAERPKTVSEDAETVAMFNAIDNGQIEVKITVQDDQNARLVAQNLTDQPLTIEIPEAFAAVPILAQNQGGGGGDGFINLAPEKFGSKKVGFICLEHGKPNPRSDMRYEVKPIETLTSDAKVIKLIGEHGAGRCSHAVAQAAAWHLQNGMSWEQLAAKQRKHLGGGSEPYFSAAQLQLAARFVTHLETLISEQDASESTSESSSGSIEFEQR